VGGLRFSQAGFLDEIKPRLFDVPVIIAVGAAFDFVAGVKSPAPGLGAKRLESNGCFGSAGTAAAVETVFDRATACLFIIYLEGFCAAIYDRQAPVLFIHPFFVHRDRYHCITRASMWSALRLGHLAFSCQFLKPFS